MGLLYVVGTPIGNFKDITLRALEILRSVNIIACEDTRVIKDLLQRHDIYGKELFSCHAYNEKMVTLKLVELIRRDGKSIAYCSNAGTPSLSDPGSFLVLSCIKHNIKIVPIPGVSAFSTLLSVSGSVCSNVSFLGFLPRTLSRRFEIIRTYLTMGSAFLLYESPYRVYSLLAILKELASQCFVALGREMTKTYEEFFYGTPDEILTALQGRKILGEVSILVASSCKY